MKNISNLGTIESTLPKYLEFRIFEIFYNKCINIIQPHCREGAKEDIYKHIFLCPANDSKLRNFQLHGVLSPFVCLWRTSPVRWNTKMYGRSVLPRHFKYIDKNGNAASETGFLYDLEFDMEVFSSSYYRSFRDQVNIDLIDLDRLRYIDIDVKELLKDCSELTTRVELMLKGMTQSDNGVDNSKNRSFDMNATYTVKMTVPYCHSFGYIENLEVYLNEHLIYVKDSEAVTEEAENQQPAP